MYNYVMYHHPDSEPSMQCLNVIRETGLASKIWIQNVEDLSPADIQETPWLDRVPVVVNRKTSEAFKGKMQRWLNWKKFQSSASQNLETQLH
jgi:hypothetical protein